MTHPDGMRTVLTKTRRLNGALTEMDGHVASLRSKFVKHALEGERVVVGPDPLVGDEVAAEVVLFVTKGSEYAVRYAVEELKEADRAT
jgi:uncharacterized protein with ACT and thioredoxin-like domain